MWLVTPNIGGYGHRLFGKDWLGLDTPRHLVLFTRASLIRAVKQAGFELVAAPVHTSTTEWYFRCSAAIAQGYDPLRAAPPLTRRLRWRLRLAKLLTWIRPELAEEAIVLARKLA